jgi:hypothetical protein
VDFCRDLEPLLQLPLPADDRNFHAYFGKDGWFVVSRLRLETSAASEGVGNNIRTAIETTKIPTTRCGCKPPSHNALSVSVRIVLRTYGNFQSPRTAE